jgi:hypothetical protein
VRDLWFGQHQTARRGPRLGMLRQIDWSLVGHLCLIAGAGVDALFLSAHLLDALGRQSRALQVFLAWPWCWP